jgi:hypothetical protein
MFDIYYLINYLKKILLYSQLLISHYSYGAKRPLFEFKKRLTVRDFFSMQNLYYIRQCSFPMDRVVALYYHNNNNILYDLKYTNTLKQSN